MTLWSEQWCAPRWLVNLNSGLRPKLSRLVSVFGLSERLIQKVKWPTVSGIMGGLGECHSILSQIGPQQWQLDQKRRKWLVAPPKGVFIATQLNSTQLNSTDPVEQRTAKSVVFLFMTSRPTNWVNLLFTLWTCRQLDVELSSVELCRYKHP